jgi:pyruvate,water dikinase
VRDEKVFYAVCAWALVRYAALEIGSRLTERGQVTRADDVFFLERDEALGALRTGAAQRELVRQRRAEHAWARLHPGPPTYGTPAADAAPMQDILRSLPPEARTAVEASLWTTRLWGGAPPAQASGDGVLRGTAASAGRYTGPVRLITGVHEFGKIRRGDVLVCPETTAQWAVLFPSIGALAADKGGLLSHPAIIAREYGVPAVVATGTATRLLRDGQIVTVDGTEGTVRYARGGLA